MRIHCHPIYRCSIIVTERHVYVCVHLNQRHLDLYEVKKYLVARHERNTYLVGATLHGAENIIQDKPRHVVRLRR